MTMPATITIARGSFIECARPSSSRRAASSLCRKRSPQRRPREITSLFSCKFSNARLTGHMLCSRNRLSHRVPKLKKTLTETLTELSIWPRKDSRRLLNPPRLFFKWLEDLSMLTNKLKLKPMPLR